jgi:hypothetical protein
MTAEKAEMPKRVDSAHSSPTLEAVEPVCALTHEDDNDKDETKVATITRYLG